MKWWLFVLAFLLGALITWIYMVRRTTREVRIVQERPILARADDGIEGDAAIAGAGALGAAAVGAATSPADADTAVDLEPAVSAAAPEVDVDIEEVTVVRPDPDVAAVDTTIRRADLVAPAAPAPVDLDADGGLDLDGADALDLDAGLDLDAPETAAAMVAVPEVAVPADVSGGIDLDGGPDLDTDGGLDLDAPSVDVPEVSVEASAVDVPDVAVSEAGFAGGIDLDADGGLDLDAPSVDVPEAVVDVPAVDVPAVDVPDVAVPETDFAGGIDLDADGGLDLDAPSVDVPEAVVDVPAVDVPAVDVPDVAVPEADYAGGIDLDADGGLDLDAPSNEVPAGHALDFDAPELAAAGVGVADVGTLEAPGDSEDAGAAPTFEELAAEEAQLLPPVDVPETTTPEIDLPEVDADLSLEDAEDLSAAVSGPEISGEFEAADTRDPATWPAEGIDLDADIAVDADAPSDVDAAVVEPPAADFEAADESSAEVEVTAEDSPTFAESAEVEVTAEDSPTFAESAAAEAEIPSDVDIPEATTPEIDLPEVDTDLSLEDAEDLGATLPETDPGNQVSSTGSQEALLDLDTPDIVDVAPEPESLLLDFDEEGAGVEAGGATAALAGLGGLAALRAKRAAEEAEKGEHEREPVVEAEPEVVTEAEAEAEPEVVTEAEVEAEPEVVTEAEAEAEPERVAQAKPEPVELGSEVEPEPIAEAEPEPVVEAEPEVVTEAEAEAGPELVVEPEPGAETQPGQATEPEPAPEVVTEAEPEAAPKDYGAGSALPAEDGSGPQGWEVKGNEGSMLFHTPASASYEVTKAEVWFIDEASAIAAGFAPWDAKLRAKAEAKAARAAAKAEAKAARAAAVAATAPSTDRPGVAPSPAATLDADMSGTPSDGARATDEATSTAASFLAAPGQTAVTEQPAADTGAVEEPATAPAAEAESADQPQFAEASYGAGSALPAGDGSGPAGWQVKGNADSMLFHTPASPYYGRTKAEVWFADEATASAAGFARWDAKAQRVEAPTLLDIPDGPYGPGSAAAGPRGKGPEGWEVKGNADSMLFHTPDSPWYKRTRAEVWFIDQASAEAAGFTHWDAAERAD